MSVDYNQLGLHVLAHLTKDPALVEPLFADARRGVIHHLGMTALNEPARVTAIVSDSDDQQVMFSDWRVNSPTAVTIGPDGDLYVADARSHHVSRINGDSGEIITLAGAPMGESPYICTTHGVRGSIVVGQRSN